MCLLGNNYSSHILWHEWSMVAFSRKFSILILKSLLHTSMNPFISLAKNGCAINIIYGQYILKTACWKDIQLYTGKATKIFNNCLVMLVTLWTCFIFCNKVALLYENCIIWWNMVSLWIDYSAYFRVIWGSCNLICMM